MRKYFLLLLFILPISIMAQDDLYRGTIIADKTNTNEPRIFSKSNTTSIIALSLYEKDNNGYYHLSENNPVDIIKDADTYAYDKKARKLYVVTFNGNYEITLNKELAGVYKKNKLISQLSGDKLVSLINKVNNKLSARFSKINENVKIAEQQKKKNQEQARLNEIKKADYMKTHEWNMLPIGTIPLKCDYCNYFTSTDSVYIFSIKNDSICYASVEDFDLETKLIKWHVSKIPDYVKKNNKFAYHCEVFKDSLKNHEFDFDKKMIEYMNAKNVLGVFDIIKGKAPNGYFVNWEWDNEYGCITFNFTYMNTSSKPIKYIKVYWTIKNDVGDVRGSGSFSGTGPVESMSSASWKWDHSSYYVAGDASKMRITRVVITYMNGTTKTLTGDNIIFN